MLPVEEAEKVDKRFDIKVFATDMAERSLTHARAGVFPGGIESFQRGSQPRQRRASEHE